MPAAPGAAFQVTYQTYTGLEEFHQTFGDDTGLPLERLLYEAGHSLVDRILVQDAAGETPFDWAGVAADAWLDRRGKLHIQGQVFEVISVSAEAPPELAAVEASILDIAPTTASALGFPVPGHAAGQTLPVAPAGHVLLLFLDGFGFQRYQAALAEGSIPFIGSLPTPRLALTIYPPTTVTSSNRISICEDTVDPLLRR